MLAVGSPLHFVLELIAYFAGVRWFLARRAKSANALSDHPEGLWVLVGAVLGAAFGSKVLAWLQFPELAFGHLGAGRRLESLMIGKTIVGGLLGGYLGVELAKLRIGLRESTGDLFVMPLVFGMVIGRVGCLLAGIGDYTYGNPTSLPWGMDQGDGIARHPTSLYEIAALAAIAVMVEPVPAWRERARGRPLPSGLRFRLFLASYFGFRLIVERLKPPHDGFAPALPNQPPAHLYGGVFTAIEIACALGLLYTSWQAVRMTRQRESP